MEPAKGNTRNRRGLNIFAKPFFEEIFLEELDEVWGAYKRGRYNAIKNGERSQIEASSFLELRGFFLILINYLAAKVGH